MYCSIVNFNSRVERMRKFNAIKNAVNFGKGKNTMNKFNEQKQIEETTEFQDSEVIKELNNEQQLQIRKNENEI